MDVAPTATAKSPRREADRAWNPKARRAARGLGLRAAPARAARPAGGPQRQRHCAGCPRSSGGLRPLPVGSIGDRPGRSGCSSGVCGRSSVDSTRRRMAQAAAAPRAPAGATAGVRVVRRRAADGSGHGERAGRFDGYAGSHAGPRRPRGSRAGVTCGWQRPRGRTRAICGRPTRPIPRRHRRERKGDGIAGSEPSTRRADALRARPGTRTAGAEAAVAQRVRSVDRVRDPQDVSLWRRPGEFDTHSPHLHSYPPAL